MGIENINASVTSYYMIYCSPNGKYVYIPNANVQGLWYSTDYGVTFTYDTTTFPGFGVIMNIYGNYLIALNGAQLKLSSA